MAEIIDSTEFSDGRWIDGRLPPAREDVVKGQEIGVVLYSIELVDVSPNNGLYTPIRNEAFARSASCSKPNGETKGLLEFNAAARDS